MKRKVHLEGGVIAEMKNGDTHYILWTRDGDIYHHGPDAAGFDPATITPEAEFRSSMRRVVSRSTYDKR